MTVAERWVPPEPEPGELPVPTMDAVGAVPGVTIWMLNKRIRDGIIPSVMPVGNKRGRRVYVSQVKAAFGGGQR